jgi:hypothetical protein
MSRPLASIQIPFASSLLRLHPVVTILCRHEGPPLVARCNPRRRHGPHGDRPRPRVLRTPGGGSDTGHLLYTVDHPLLRAGVCLSRRRFGISARAEAWRHVKDRALSRHARPRSRRARAHRASCRVDVQPARLRIHSGRGYLDDRLVHGRPCRAHLASASGHRRHSPTVHAASLATFWPCSGACRCSTTSCTFPSFTRPR